jgi:hypothetical protein
MRRKRGELLLDKLIPNNCQCWQYASVLGGSSNDKKWRKRAISRTAKIHQYCPS